MFVRKTNICVKILYWNFCNRIS